MAGFRLHSGPRKTTKIIPSCPRAGEPKNKRASPPVAGTGEKFRDEAEGKTRILQVEVRSREEAEGLIANLNRKVVSLDKNAEAVEK